MVQKSFLVRIPLLVRIAGVRLGPCENKILLLGPYVNQILILVRGSRGKGRTVQKSNSPSGQGQPARVGPYRKQILFLAKCSRRG